MKTAYVIQRINEINFAFNKASTTTDPLLSSYLASFLAVFACGVYEDCVEFLFEERANKSNDPELAAFVKSTLHLGFRNPNYENIKKLVVRFGASYGSQFKTLTSQTLITALNNIVTNKNDFAHAGQYKITLGDFNAYHTEAQRIFDIIETIFGL